MGLTISRLRVFKGVILPRRLVVRSIIIIIVLLLITQTYLSSLKTVPIRSTARYIGTNYDELTQFTPRRDVEAFCNKLPTPRKKRGLVISDKTKADGPLKIFYWRWQHGNKYAWIDWEWESQTMCPIPLELQEFFDTFRTEILDKPNLDWKTGYAPKHSGYLDYTFSTNYTDFPNADIVYMDHPFLMGSDKPPYFSSLLLPPKLAHQKWVLRFSDDSLAAYPYIALPAFLHRFDLTMGSPPSMMDIPDPTYPITQDKVLELVNAKPSVAFNKKTDDLISIVTSECWPWNKRNGLIDHFIEKAGAHSYGGCKTNKEIPKELTKEGLPRPYVKQKLMSKYPFGLAAEHSNCISYVTEKIYDVLASGAIPVYFGASDIADFVPEGSYIDVKNFKDYDEVVEYMRIVDRAPFYKWKEIVKKDPTKFCKRCFPTPVESDWCAIVDNVQYV
ncbi:4-alpha-L-fucosyltransferase [Mortierella sp. AD032]|nr:4-alpha-L-fucosyltransferase [Mortierella sp. AD032]